MLRRVGSNCSSCCCNRVVLVGSRTQHIQFGGNIISLNCYCRNCLLLFRQSDDILSLILFLEKRRRLHAHTLCPLANSIKNHREGHPLNPPFVSNVYPSYPPASRTPNLLNSPLEGPPIYLPVNFLPLPATSNAHTLCPLANTININTSPPLGPLIFSIDHSKARRTTSQ